MLETLIAIGAACIVFMLFLLVFFFKDQRERETGRRSGCQAHAQEGGGCRCKGQSPSDRKPDHKSGCKSEPLILDHR